MEKRKLVLRFFAEIVFEFQNQGTKRKYAFSGQADFPQLDKGKDRHLFIYEKRK